MISHMTGYQHIDLSLKKHGLYSDKNPAGYKVHFLVFPEDMLNEMEQKYKYLYVSQLCDGHNLTYKVNGLCPSGTQSTKEEWGKGK